MSGDPLEGADSDRLSRILAWSDPEVAWNPRELAMVLRHQLATRLELDLAGAVAGSDAGEIQSIGDLLRHPNPPIAWLLALKEFAKANAMHPEGGIPREIAQLLYYAAILSAWTRCGQRISSLDLGAIRQSVTEILAAPWLDDSARALLGDGLLRLACVGGDV